MADTTNNEGLKANIPIHEVKLDNGDIVVFYDYITTGESRELQKILLEGGKFNSQTGQIEDLPLGVFLASQDKAASLVIKEVKSGDKTEAFSQDWLNSLPVEIGNKIYDEVNRLTQVSSLTQDQKKV